LNSTGRFILDGASGPIPHPEQSVYAEGFDYRICLDFSIEALRAARTKLGAKGIYILGDLTRLPLADDTVDAVISLHTLYHVPADEQKNALEEIYRALKPGARAVVVYSWGKHSVLMRLASTDHRINRAIIRALAFLTGWRRKGIPDQGSEPPADPPVNLYFYAHPFPWLMRALGTLGPFKLTCWRSVGLEFQRAYIHDWLYGRQILAILYWFEDKFPWLLGRLGQYPMFVICKPLIRHEG
jgi:SAM-dependent methyltransferase